MKKTLKIMSIILLGIISIWGLFYIRYVNFDTYTWDTDNKTLTLGGKQYKSEFKEIDTLSDIELEKRIGKIVEIDGQDSSFRVWSIKGESTEEHIAILGLMYPVDIYSRVK